MAVGVQCWISIQFKPYVWSDHCTSGIHLSVLLCRRNSTSQRVQSMSPPRRLAFASPVNHEDFEGQTVLFFLDLSVKWGLLINFKKSQLVPFQEMTYLDLRMETRSFFSNTETSRQLSLSRQRCMIFMLVVGKEVFQILMGIYHLRRCLFPETDFVTGVFSDPLDRSVEQGADRRSNPDFQYRFFYKENFFFEDSETRLYRGVSLNFLCLS